MAKVKTKHWICPKCARALTYDFIDFKSSRMDTVRASQELTKMKIRHKQLGCDADNRNQRRSSCLIATTCVTHFGMRDDCRELTVLRRFRDQQLLTTPAGTRLVNRYYDLAPTLLVKISASPKADELWNEIYQQIFSWVVLIERHEAEVVIIRYQAYLKHLIDRLSFSGNGDECNVG